MNEGKSDTRLKISWRDPLVSCILLNNLDAVDRRLFLDDWLRSRVRICADGALALLKALAVQFGIELATIYPDYLVGDLDSTSREEVEDYSKHGGHVVRVGSQDATDFEKCVRVAKDEAAISSNSGEWLLVYGAFGGERLDHALGAFHPLFVHGADMRVKLVHGGHAAAFVVPSGSWRLDIDERLVGRTCGLFPMAGPARTTTDGLEWNLNDRVLEYGALVSVSNRAISGNVLIECDRPLLMTLQYV